MEPAFYPMRSGRLVDALRHHGWPVTVDVFDARIASFVWLVVAAAAVVGTAAEVLIQSARADELTRQSVKVTATIASMTSGGDKQRAGVPYIVDGQSYSASFTVTWDDHVGDPVTLRYLPDAPGRVWLDGDDPPGTDEAWLGLAVLPALLIAVMSRDAKGLRQRRHSVRTLPTVD